MATREDGDQVDGPGVKHDTDKPRLELISAIATFKKARVYTQGAQKYGVDNWRKGLAWSRVIGALLRHVFAYISGETNDPETGESHMAHAACCVDFLLEYEDTHPELDDRFKTGTAIPGYAPEATCKGCGESVTSSTHLGYCSRSTKVIDLDEKIGQ